MEGSAHEVEADAGLGPKKGSGWRESKWLAAAELAAVALIFVADAHHLIFFSKTPCILLFGWISLRLRRVSWRSIGFTLYGTWKKTLLLGMAGGVLIEALELFVSQPLLTRFLHQPPDLSDFRALTGNFKLTVASLILVWTLAAFGEELVYRGYLMNRVVDLMPRSKAAWVVSLLVVHIGFGLAHAYQGLTGVLDEGLMGVLLGVMYLRTGRNLAVPIVAHGIQDSIDCILIFLGKYPGM